MKIYLLLILASSPASAYYNGMEAEKVIGQVNFTQVQACQGGTVSSNSFSSPHHLHAGNLRRDRISLRPPRKSKSLDLHPSSRDDGCRYSLRTDGFVAVSAGYGGGEITTPPMCFSGGTLELNYSTSAVGW